LTYNGSVLTLYQNGIGVATTNVFGTFSAGTQTLQIGGSKYGDYFKGLIDEVRIYNTALNATEAQTIYQQESGPTPQVATNPVTQPFSFSLSNSGNKSVTAGSSVTNSISTSLSSGSTQAVTFSASGLPTGATASFSSPSCSPACSSTLTINTTTSTPAGNSTITVTATGGGITKTTTFSLTVSSLTVATPTISPNGGSFTGPVSMTMQTATSGASIYYTTNGSTPTQSATLYTGAVTLTSSATVKAKAFKSGYNASPEASASFTISQGLVAHWKFDEGTGTTASDSSGNGNTGTLINGPLWIAGKVGNALYFDGMDDNVNVLDSNSLDLSSSFTLSAWVNPSSTSTNWNTILVKNDRYHLFSNVTGSACTDGSPLGGFSTTQMNYVCPSSPIPLNTWTHLTLTYNGSVLTLYQNGVGVATSNVSGTLSSGTETLQIGGNKYGQYFKGLIDEVRVYSRALSGTEIQTIYQQESATSQTVATSPVNQSFSFSLSNSGNKSVIAGSSVTNSISTTLASGSPQAVTFSASGLLSGASASFSSASCSPACSSTLTINTTASTPAGSSTITVTAAGGGLTKTTTFSLTVSLPTVTTVATPTISPNGGSFTSPVSVTMQTATSGASIYYTTNGSTPTQSSTVYTGAMNLTSSAVVKAKAFKSGSNPSAEASASFTVSELSGIAKAVTRYADNALKSDCTNGTYSVANRNCNAGGKDGDAYTTIEGAASGLSGPGAVIEVRGSATVYTGTGEHSAINIAALPRGAAGNHLTIRGRSGENTRLRGLDGQSFGTTFMYLTVKDLILEGSGGNAGLIGVFGFYGGRLENVEIRNFGDNGMLGIGESEMINLNVHHNGFSAGCAAGPGCHGLYTGGDAHNKNNIIDGGEYHHNFSFGIQCYTKCDGSTIRNVRVHNNGASGMIVAFGSGVVVHNVIADNNPGHGVWLAAAGAVLYNATAYNNGANGVCIDNSGITVNNVIAIGNSTNLSTNCNSGTYSFTSSNNITSGSAENFFVDANSGNFQLISTSTVEGVGADLSSLN
jgi:hypothetical protein